MKLYFYCSPTKDKQIKSKTVLLEPMRLLPRFMVIVVLIMIDQANILMKMSHFYLFPIIHNIGKDELNTTTIMTMASHARQKGGIEGVPKSKTKTI